MLAAHSYLPLVALVAGCAASRGIKPISMPPLSPGYMMCDWVFVERPSELSEAIARVERLEATARAAEGAGDHAGAAQGYLRAAEALAWIGRRWRAAEIEDHRLVEYANITNALLNDGRVEEARRVIRRAVSRDRALATELRAMVAALPGPASCSRTNPSATTSRVDDPPSRCLP